MPKRRGTKKQQKKHNDKKPKISGINIITVTKGNVNQANQHLTKGQAMVEFYHPNCGHCQTLKPEWEKMCFELKKNYHGKAVIAAVDCSDQEMLQKLEIEQNFRGFPSIFHMNDGRCIHEYQGDRTKDSLLSFAKSRLPISTTKQQLEPATHLFFSPKHIVHRRKKGTNKTIRRRQRKKSTKKRRQKRKKGTKTTKK